jgi:hypothetical protein
MRIGLIILVLAIVTSPVFGRQSGIFTSDINNFWKAYDKVIRISDSAEQERIIQQFYLDKGSAGLRDFARARNWTAGKFRSAILQHPEFWRSVRRKTMVASRKGAAIRKLFTSYQQLYPGFKRPDVFFMIGHIETGGTTTQTRVLLGTEIVAADSSVNAEGLHPMLQRFFLSNPDIMGLVAHELTHTQQRGGDMETRRKSNLLGFCIAEGACDFIAELLTGKTLMHPYLVYGRAHDRELWVSFKGVMYGTATQDWLYNGGLKATKVADLGYYMGYAICKSYYQHAADKARAVREIIELDLEDKAKVDLFLANSGYDAGGSVY